MKIDDYIDLAKKNTRCRSDRALSNMLNFAGNGVSNWRTKRSWPTEANMIDLARLANVDPEIALLDLATWRTANTPAAAIYRNLIQKITATAATIALALPLLGNLPHSQEHPANNQNSTSGLYILCP